MVESRKHKTAKAILEDFYKKPFDEIETLASEDDEEFIDWGPDVGAEVQEEN